MPNIIQRIRDFFTRSEVVSTSTLDKLDDFWYGLIGASTSSGVSVSQETAMRQWAVFACITEISQNIAQLPLKLKRPAAGGGTEDARDHPLYDICKILPNPQMTSFNWRESQQAYLLTNGNNYNFIERSRYEIKSLWPIDPSLVIPREANREDINRLRLPKNDRIVYEILTTNGPKVYPSKDILHIVGFGWNGLIGESIITNFAKESIGNAIILDQFQGKAMKNGYFPSGVFEHPDKLTDKESFIKALDRRYAGPENAKRPMVLEQDMKFKATNISMVDKQLIEQMRMTAFQICGMLKVPPHRVGIYEKNTNYNNTEQGNKSFKDSCLQPWVTRWEQTLAWKLLTKEERQEGYFFKHNFDALLRPDAKTRSEIQWKEWQTGVPLNVIRERNDENPVEGGDISYIPANMIPSHLAGKQIENDISKNNESQDELLDDDISGLKSLEKNAITREIKKQLAGRSDKIFDDFLDEFYYKLFDKIDKRTRLIIRCFNNNENTEIAISEIKKEFESNKQKIKELQKCNWENIEDIWNE